MFQRKITDLHPKLRGESLHFRKLGLLSTCGIGIKMKFGSGSASNRCRSTTLVTGIFSHVQDTIRYILSCSVYHTVPGTYILSCSCYHTVYSFLFRILYGIFSLVQDTIRYILSCSGYHTVYSLLFRIPYGIFFLVQDTIRNILSCSGYHTVYSLGPNIYKSSTWRRTFCPLSQ